MLPTAPQFAKASSIVGLIGWALTAFLNTSSSPETDLINKILLLGILVVVPLGLSLVETPDRENRHGLSYKAAVYAQPFGAVAA
ncbi:MAG: hypothetical protein ACMG6H_07805, partial [Acidobacteriota bacterium]